MNGGNGEYSYDRMSVVQAYALNGLQPALVEAVSRMSLPQHPASPLRIADFGSSTGPQRLRLHGLPGVVHAEGVPRSQYGDARSAVVLQRSARKRFQHLVRVAAPGEGASGKGRGIITFGARVFRGWGARVVLWAAFSHE